MDWHINNKYEDGSNYTWEVKTYKPGAGAVGSNYYPYNPVKEAGPPPTDEEMIKDILSRAEDGGFFKDMVEWLRRDAPRKLRKALNELRPPMHKGPVAYDRLCEVLYQVGFRASEILERRMILGPSNDWVQRYFEDFPKRA